MKTALIALVALIVAMTPVLANDPMGLPVPDKYRGPTVTPLPIAIDPPNDSTGISDCPEWSNRRCPTQTDEKDKPERTPSRPGRRTLSNVGEVRVIDQPVVIVTPETEEIEEQTVEQVETTEPVLQEPEEEEIAESEETQEDTSEFTGAVVGSQKPTSLLYLSGALLLVAAILGVFSYVRKH